MKLEALCVRRTVATPTPCVEERNNFGDTREAPDDNAAWMKAMPLTKRKRLDFAGIESGIDLVYPPCPP